MPELRMSIMPAVIFYTRTKYECNVFCNVFVLELNMSVMSSVMFLY